jgi:hypothetical protein
MCLTDFVNRSTYIRNFREYLENLEDNHWPDWFKHKGNSGRVRFQKAEYLEMDGNAFEVNDLSFRFRRDISGPKLGKTDFAVKFKSGNPSFAPKPMVAATEWRAASSCKTESNLKHYACPHRTCYPGSACDEACPELGSAGIGLEFKEQVGKIKGNADDPLAQQYESAAHFTQLSSITSFFPDIVPYFELAPLSAPLRISQTQFRYVNDKIDLEINGADVESTLTLWYATENDLMNEHAVPSMGAWSFKTELGMDNWGNDPSANRVIIAAAENQRCS